MATHPTTTTHRSMTEAARVEIGLTPGAGMLRLSGTWKARRDLARDLARALDAV